VRLGRSPGALWRPGRGLFRERRRQFLGGRRLQCSTISEN
jgi:hypothetical protein